MKKILILSDVHCPYHDKDAVALVLKVGQAIKPDGIVINGDFCDFYKISSHSKDPARKMAFVEETEECKVLLQKFIALGARDNYFIYGNHEDRFDRYIQDKAPELYGVTSISKLLGLTEMGWIKVKYRKFITLGKVLFTHDLANHGQHAVQKALFSAQKNIVIGHCHRIGLAVQGDALGRSKVGVSFGWLGDVEKADYMHSLKAVQEWAQGFGVGYLDGETGAMLLTPIPILNIHGKKVCLFEGKKYTI
jgi:predicted phosphodiesterase